LSSVYVVQEVPGRNILGARSYGDLKVLLPPNTNIVLSPAPTVRRIKEGLKDFSSEDYLLLMGDPAVIGLACAIASQINVGRYSILKWDRIEKDYYPVEIDIHSASKGVMA
jgi:hypothetical protein|tara:strand:+ start:1230 stop:1562 length:333 start_codon:yes stop_codon:yes gene_type:complete